MHCFRIQAVAKPRKCRAGTAANCCTCPWLIPCAGPRLRSDRTSRCCASTSPKALVSTATMGLTGSMRHAGPTPQLRTAATFHHSLPSRWPRTTLPWGNSAAARARPWTPTTCLAVQIQTGTQQRWCWDPLLTAYCANSDPAEGRRLCRCLTEGRRLLFPCLAEEPHPPRSGYRLLLLSPDASLGCLAW